MTTPAATSPASYRPRHGRRIACAVALLVAVVVALASPGSARAAQPSAGRLTAPLLIPTKSRPSAADQRPTDVWLAAALSSAIVLGACGLALWTEHGRTEDDDESDGDDGWGHGGPDRSQPPTGPGGHEIDWAAFEAEFRTYAERHERSFELASAR